MAVMLFGFFLLVFSPVSLIALLAGGIMLAGVHQISIDQHANAAIAIIVSVFIATIALAAQ